MGKENSIHIWTVIFKLHCVIFAKVMAYFQVLVPIQFYGNHSQMYYYQEKNVNLSEWLMIVDGLQQETSMTRANLNPNT